MAGRDADGIREIEEDAMIFWFLAAAWRAAAVEARRDAESIIQRLLSMKGK